ncbi:MAG: hypothetical protein ACK5UI_03785 [Bacteroidota bacterium]|jgi:hypothetical protein
MKCLFVILLGFGFTLPATCGKNKKDVSKCNHSTPQTEINKMALFGPKILIKTEKAV